MASGDVLAKFFPGQQEPLASGFAAPSPRNAHLIILYDDTTDERSVFKDVLKNYAGGGFTVDVLFAMSTATTGNIVVQVAIERIGEEVLDIDTDSFAAYQTSGAIAVPGTSGFLKKAIVTLTNGAQIDSLLNGEPFRIDVRRDADDTSATDSASGDMELWSVVLSET